MMNNFYSFSSDPCGEYGSCTNTPGYFVCTCEGRTGNRCQYPVTCLNVTCSDGEVCISSLTQSTGYFCEAVPSPEDSFVVSGVTVHPGFLDDLLVNYREEIPQVSNNGHCNYWL